MAIAYWPVGWQRADFFVMRRSTQLSLAVCLALAQAHAGASECVRSEPQPLVAATAAGVSAHRFQRVNPAEATEDLTLVSGERFHLTHGGCEYYVIGFSVAAGRSAKAPLGIAAALALAARGLRRLDGLSHRSSFDLKRSAAAIERLRQSRADVIPGHEYPVEGDGEDFLQTRIVFDADQTAGARFRLIKGPL